MEGPFTQDRGVDSLSIKKTPLTHVVTTPVLWNIYTLLQVPPVSFFGKTPEMEDFIMYCVLLQVRTVLFLMIRDLQTP